MNLRAGFEFIAVPLLVLAVAALPVAAQEQTGKHRDNSGRQIAVVVPGLPHPVTPPVVVQTKPITIGVPSVKLTPEAKETLNKSVVVAQGLSNVAVKRASDVVTWVSTMWRELNDVPTMTPAREFSPATPSVGSMRPLDTDRQHQLFYTSERRLKTVVAR